MNEINLQIWYSARAIEFVPPHFIRAETNLTEDSLFWVRSRLQGRYSIQLAYDNNVLFTERTCVYFEDSAEAMLFELRWAGSN